MVKYLVEFVAVRDNCDAIRQWKAIKLLRGEENQIHTWLMLNFNNQASTIEEAVKKATSDSIRFDVFDSLTPALNRIQSYNNCYRGNRNYNFWPELETV